MFFSPRYTFTLLHTDVTDEPVIVSFDPTTYTVTEGVDGVANLMLVRSGNLTAPGTAKGMTHHSLLPSWMRTVSYFFLKARYPMAKYYKY